MEYGGGIRVKKGGKVMEIQEGCYGFEEEEKVTERFEKEIERRSVPLGRHFRSLAFIGFSRTLVLGVTPLGFLVGLPFAILSLSITFIGALLWIFWSLLSLICPCCACFAVLSNLSLSLVKLPIKVLDWFIDTIPF